MESHKLLVTGFEPFDQHARNPSGELALLLASAPPPGVEISAACLPVSYERSALELNRLLEHRGHGPSAESLRFLAMGVHPGPGFRLEQVASPRQDPDRTDADGVPGSSLPERPQTQHRTNLDLAHFAAILERAGAAPVAISRDAGGYVCEWVYRHLLAHSLQWSLEGFFLHVPPASEIPIPDQLPIVHALARAMAEQSDHAKP